MQRWNFIAPAVPGERTHFSTGEVLLRPGETAPFVLHGVAREPGEYELAAVGLFCPTREELIPVMAAQPLDVPWSEQNTLQLRITRNSGTYTNLRGEKSRKFAGTLISNVVKSEVTGD